MFERSHTEGLLTAVLRPARLGSAAAAFTVGILLLGAKLGLTANYQHELALNATAVVLPAVEVVAHRPAPLAAVAGASAIR